MNRENKITEGQIQLDDRNNYQPLDKPMVGDTFQRVKHLINSPRQAGCIDEMTAKWFNQTPDPPRIPVFYTLTKIHKPTLVGRPIISGCDLRPVQTHYTRTIQHSTLYNRHCIALLGKVFKRTIHGLYNHSTSMTKQRIVG